MIVNQDKILTISKSYFEIAIVRTDGIHLKRYYVVINIIYMHIARLVNEASEQFPVILTTGARQVGKTTLLKSLDANRTFVTLDDPIIRDLAQHDPTGGMQTYRHPVLIDEFQYAPGLLPYIKWAGDRPLDFIRTARSGSCAGRGGGEPRFSPPRPRRTSPSRVRGACARRSAAPRACAR